MPAHLVHLVPNLINRHHPDPVPLSLGPAPKRHDAHERVSEDIQLGEVGAEAADECFRGADNVGAEGGVAVDAEVEQGGVGAGEDGSGAKWKRMDGCVVSGLVSCVLMIARGIRRTENRPWTASHTHHQAS